MVSNHQGGKRYAVAADCSKFGIDPDFEWM